MLGYDGEAKNYTYHAIDSMGMADSSKGTYANGTWSWSSENTMGGKTIKFRYEIKEVSPTEYTFKGEMSDDGSTWKPMMSGTEKKVVTAKKKS
jgi:hypothetical protein